MSMDLQSELDHAAFNFDTQAARTRPGMGREPYERNARLLRRAADEIARLRAALATAEAELEEARRERDGALAALNNPHAHYCAGQVIGEGPDAACMCGAERRDGAGLIATERRRQVEDEGWTLQHDEDEHYGGELLEAAIEAAIAVSPAWSADHADRWGVIARAERKFPDEPDRSVRLLTIAGALIAAEIDRLQRLAAPEARAQGEGGGV